MSAAITVENLSKAYRIGLKEEIPDTLLSAATSVLRAPLKNFKRLRGLDTYSKNGDAEDIIWALKDVSFEVQEGEVLGVIGRNGAGKSTLLKILSRITKPTSGRAIIRGRVSSLLEVGTGFHPELSGRENVYMNGTILGMTKREIDRKFDEIVDFSGVEKFLDTPIKRYSSGMKVRLAFAVAAHLEPEILIIDEVLAVGDAEFQKKCLGKMQDVADAGRTVLFVSHNMQAVSTLTDRCLLIQHGTNIQDGDPRAVIQKYLEAPSHQQGAYSNNPSKDGPRVIRADVVTSEGNAIHQHGQPLQLRFLISTPVVVSSASLSFQICDNLGRPINHIWTFDSERPMCRTPGVYELLSVVPRCRLYLGKYTLTVHFGEGPGGRKFETIENVCPFEIVMHRISREFPWRPGTCAYVEDFEWAIRHLGDSPCLNSQSGEAILFAT